MCGADVQAPCVNNSRHLTHIKGTTLWLGLGLVQSLESTLILSIVKEQSQEPFKDLYDFKSRCEPGIEQLKILISIGAFRFIPKTRKALFWEAHALYAEKKKQIVTPKLFEEQPGEVKLPSLEDSWLEIAIDQRELIGFTLYDAFQLIQPDHIPISNVRNQHLPSLMVKSVYLEGRLVTVKPTRTTGGKEMNFGTWLDRDGYFFDSVHFPTVVSRYPFKGRGIYRLWGTVVEDFGVVAVEVAKMEKLPLLPDPRSL